MSQDFIDSIISDFPQLNIRIDDKKLIYFDSGATSLKPKEVIETLQRFYAFENASTHSQHFLSANLSQKIRKVRDYILKFINADDSYEVIFTKNATEGFNLIANGISSLIDPKKPILSTEMEHHSNLVPWQQLAKRNQLELNFIPVTQDFELDKDLSKYFEKAPGLVSFTHVSNVLGTINPIEELLKYTQNSSAISVVDGTQAIPHFKPDFGLYQPDFYVFSGHKVFGPTGVGVVIGKKKLLDQMQPWQFGGDMVDRVSLHSATWAEIPEKFEAGTQNFANILALEVALRYLENLREKLDPEQIEQGLINHFISNLKEISELEIIRPKASTIPIFSVNFKEGNNFDLSAFLDLQGIACRTGSLCAQPLLKKLSLESVCRFSLSFYNTTNEIDECTEAIKLAIRKLKL